MKTLKRKFASVCIFFLASLLVISGVAMTRRPHQSDGSQTKLSTLNAQLLQLEMKQLEVQMADMRRQAPMKDGLLTEIATLETLWQGKRQELQQLTGEVMVHSTPEELSALNQDVLLQQMNSLRVQILEIRLPEVGQQILRLKREHGPAAKDLPELKALQSQWQQMFRQHKALTTPGVNDAASEQDTPANVLACAADMLDAGDPTYNRVLAFAQGGGCVLSGVGTAVFYEAYEFQVVAGGSVTATLCAAGGGAASFDSFLTIYQAAGGAQQPCPFIPGGCTNALAANDDFCSLQSEISATVVAGYFYVVVTSFSNGVTGSFTLNVTQGMTPLACAKRTTAGDCGVPPAPPNDDCAGAITLACPGTATQDTTLATGSTVNINCGSFSDQKDVWYKFVGDGGTHTICTNGSDYDTEIQIYTGTCAALNDEPYCDDDGTCGIVFGQSSVTFTATLGVTYFIQVTDFLNTGGNLVLSCDNAAPVVSPNPLNFGAVHLGTSSGPLMTSVAVTGCGSVMFTSITEGGTNPGDFSETLPGTPFTLDECDFPTTFPSTFNADGPACGGARSATLTYMTSAGMVVQTLTGTATNTAPVADAGPDQTVPEGAMVTLAGAATDADAHDSAGPFTFAWTQTGGPVVVLSNPAAASPTFTAPEVPNGACVNLTFSLVVFDLHGCADATPDTVVIRVADTVILQDDSNGNCVIVTRTCVTATSATYCFKTGGGMTFTGACLLTVNGNTINVQSAAGDPNVFQGILDTLRCRGSARLTLPNRTTHTITSVVNACNDVCTCP
jgi:hypothetical protein